MSVVNDTVVGHMSYSLAPLTSYFLLRCQQHGDGGIRRKKTVQLDYALHKEMMKDELPQSGRRDS